MTENKIALLIFSLVFINYLRLLPPGIVIEGDSGEFAAVVDTLGIAHSPGFPFYILTAKLFSLLLFWTTTAYALNIFSALCGTLCGVLLWKSLRQLDVSPNISLFSPIVLLLSFEFWYQSQIVEVYGFAMMLMSLSLLVVLKLKKESTKRWFFSLGLLTGLGIATHVYLWALFPLLLVLLGLQKALKLSLSRWKSIVLGFFVGLLPFIYMPIRAGKSLYLNLGDVSSFSRFWNHITWGLQRNRIGQASNQLPEGLSLLDIKLKQLGFFLNNFIDQVGAFGGILILIISLLPIVIIFNESFKLKRFSLKQFKTVPNWYWWSVLSAIYFLAIIWLIFTPPNASPSDMGELSTHLITTYWVFVFLFAHGLMTLESKVFDIKPFGKYIIPSCLTLLLVAHIITRQSQLDLSENKLAYEHAEKLLKNAPSNSILIADGDNDLMPLVYKMAVKNERTDIILLNMNQHSEWYYQNTKKLYPNLKWPLYSNSFLSLLLKHNYNNHSIYFTNMGAAFFFLQNPTEKDRWLVMPEKGIFRLLKKEDEDEVSIYSSLNEDFTFNTPLQSLRHRELDVIIGYSSFHLEVSKKLIALKEWRLAGLQLKQMESFPLNKSPFGLALLREANHTFNKLPAHIKKEL